MLVVLKNISDINLSPANKNLFTISFILYIQQSLTQWSFIQLALQNKISPNVSTLLNGVLRPKLLNSLFNSCLLINLDFLLPPIAHFHNIINLPLLVSETLGFMYSIYFLHFYQ